MKKTICIIIIVCLLVALIVPILWIATSKEYSNARKLIKAIETEDTQTVQSLLDSGVNPNATDIPVSKFWTFFEFTARRPLTIACDTGNLEIIGLMIDHGATAEYIEYAGWSPLRKVLQQTNSGDLEAVKLLLDHGADPQVVESDENAIFAAAQMYPITYGSEGYPTGYSEDTAQMIAQIVDLLLADGDVDMQNQYGNTLLMCAAERGNAQLVEYLLDKGCDTTLVNNSGKTAYDIAVEKKHDVVVALLQQKTGDGLREPF